MNQRENGASTVPGGQMTGGQAFTETQKACFSVNLEKMTAGIGTIFTGVMQLLAALEHDPDGADGLHAVEGGGQPVGGGWTADEPTVGNGGKENAGEAFVGDMVDHGHDADCVSDAAMSTVNPAVGPASVTADAAKAGCEQERAGKVALTADDISKVVIQKIKQDRAKGPAIGALLKTYGADHISKLAPEHYESFMTEVAQL